MGSNMTSLARFQISLAADLHHLVISQIKSFYINGSPTYSSFGIFIFRGEYLYITHAMVYEAHKWGTVDTESKTLMNGFSQESVLGAFEDLWERFQSKFSPYPVEVVNLERNVD
ncbi:hypothetical protein E8E12_000399 [Didymella heteroderae]|uniref:Uncharacterized protein n=1 Tax=Didymella heteroderae TaxID=1769908 RepID=A0A9P4WWE5_9PLEO|nr:hypothetical protein E8E12_000399 [Didymella heteroderae]